MDGTRFDRLTRAFFERLVSRRGLLGFAGGAVVGIGPRVARATQLGPATCGDQGAVCTLLSGCCDGLTCVTSAINTSYGVCVPGEGGMISTGTTLISPHSETVVEEVTALVQAVPTTTVDLQAEREARIAELKARKDAKRSKRKTRLDTKRSTRRTRNDVQQDRRLEALEDAEVALGPQLELELLLSEADEDGDGPGGLIVPIDAVRVTNRDDVNVVLTRIETTLGAIDSSDLTTSQFVLSPGESYVFVSGLQVEDAADATDNQYRWLNQIVCDDEAVTGDGYRVKAAFSRNVENHEFVVLCDGPRVISSVETPVESPRRKRKKNDAKNKRQSGNRQKNKR